MTHNKRGVKGKEERRMCRNKKKIRRLVGTKKRSRREEGSGGIRKERIIA